MSSLTSFNHHFFQALLKIRAIVIGLFGVLIVDAAVIAYAEKLSFADALYFTLITGLTIGYGDIAPATLIGRTVAILAGLQGMLITGLVAAVAVFALREAIEHPGKSH